MRWKVNRAIAQVGRVERLDVTLDAAASDELMALWVDDVCWQVQLVTWAMQRPPWWRRELREQARVVEHSRARQKNIDGKDG
jgi:hypothetical protein